MIKTPVCAGPKIKTAGLSINFDQAFKLNGELMTNQLDHIERKRFWACRFRLNLRVQKSVLEIF